MTAIHGLPDVPAVQPAGFRRRAIRVVAALLAAISASAVCAGSAAAGKADKPRPSPHRLWQTFPLGPQRAPTPLPRPFEAAQTVPVSRARIIAPPVAELATRSQPTAETSGGGAGAVVGVSTRQRNVVAVLFLGVISSAIGASLLLRWRGRDRKPESDVSDGVAEVSEPPSLAPDAPMTVPAPQAPAPAAAPVPVAAPPPVPVEDEDEDTAAATVPAASRPAYRSIDEVLRDAVSDEEAVAAAVARAQRDRTAVSLVIVRAGTDDVAEEILDAMTKAAPAGSWNASSRFGGKHWLILYGVLPKRARELAETVLYAGPSLASLMSLHGAGVGVAGFPRHARSAGELVCAAEGAAEVAAGSAGRDAVVLADRDPTLVAGPTGADER